ncbi:MAG TPA: XRE family transcriptional regulator [Clostridium sp.]|nr:XRE family transcriptional regulator [Clostridium sp.]
MNSRLKELRKSLNLTQKQFGDVLGITNSAISDIEKGKASLTDRNISLICEKLNVNEEWLRYGKGDIYRFDDLPTDDLTTALASIDKENYERIKSLLIKYSKLDSNSKKVVNDFLELFLKEQKK